MDEIRQDHTESKPRETNVSFSLSSQGPASTLHKGVKMQPAVTTESRNIKKGPL